MWHSIILAAVCVSSLTIYRFGSPEGCNHRSVMKAPKLHFELQTIFAATINSMWKLLSINTVADCDYWHRAKFVPSWTRSARRRPRNLVFDHDQQQRGNSITEWVSKMNEHLIIVIRIFCVQLWNCSWKRFNNNVTNHSLTQANI